MSAEIRVRAKARSDLEEAASWYDRQRAGLGYRFLDEVESAFQKITENPTGCPVIYRDTRRRLLLRFPFGIFYQITKQAIVVIAVMHSSRDPNRWMTRP